MDKVKGDYWTFTTFFLTVVYVIVGFGMFALPDQVFFIPFVFFGLSFIAFLFLLYRVRIVDRILESNIEVDAEVVGKHMWSRYPHFKVVYNHNGEEINKRIYVMRGKKAKRINQGDRVRLFVDQVNSRRVLIKEMFLDESMM